MEDGELLLYRYGMKRVKKHPMFELKNEEGLYQKLVTAHLREDNKKFSETLIVKDLK